MLNLSWRKSHEIRILRTWLDPGDAIPVTFPRMNQLKSSPDEKISLDHFFFSLTAH